MRLCRSVPARCLCLLLALCWCVVPQSAAGQPRSEGKQDQSAEIAEADRLNRLVVEMYRDGLYADAIPVALRALAIYEKAHAPEHLSLATALGNLAALYEARGDYAKAEPLYLRGVAIAEKAHGSEHPTLAAPLNNLAELYRRKGDLQKAEPLYRRALSIYEKAHGAEHPSIAPMINNLALLYRTKGDYARAELLYLRSLALREKESGVEDPQVATSLNNLAELYDAKGDYARAEPLYLRAIAIYEKKLHPLHPSLAAALNNLAEVYRAKGDYARAEPLYLRDLSISEKALGRDHPDVAGSLDNLAGLYEAKGNYTGAVQFYSRSQEVQERSLALILSTGSERQKLAYLSKLSGYMYSTVSLHTRSSPSNSQALRLALTTVLRRKGRALDAMSDQVGALRKRLDPQDREPLDQLSNAQSQLASLVLGGTGKTPTDEHRAAVARLEAEVERLQDAVSRRSAEFQAQTRPVTVGQVQEALPAGAALVEFFSYRPFDARAKTYAERYGARRYVAYVLWKEGEPAWADLGEAAPTDSDVARLRAALKDPRSKNYKEIARSLEERVMRPVRKLLGETRHVFISPDATLNLVPFGALVDEGGKYLVETYSITYLTSGRDLLRLQSSVEGKQPPLVIADPVFDAAGDDPGDSRGQNINGRRSVEMGQMRFSRLPGTAEEAKALGAALPEVRVLTELNATEATLKQVSRPRILHIATHGFFLPDRPRDEADKNPGNSEARAASVAENPLLRSGIALEGANGRAGQGGEDGILTALEAAGLDLWGTKLVVLSACETGIGEVRNGEGVYGLRRALVLAGSESQVMSLWQVSDDATRDLMVSYYKRLQAGEGRTEALRQAQLKMLGGGARQESDAAQRGLGAQPDGAAKADRSHPFYWAAFIQSGNWRPLETTRAPSN